MIENATVQLLQFHPNVIVIFASMRLCNRYKIVNTYNK